MDRDTGLRGKVVSNMAWRFAERCGAQGVAFVVSILLARILEPEAYGLIALVTVITGILQVFVDSGIASALIQKKDADDLDFSSAFYFNILFCAVLYTGLFFLAPTIAGWYSQPELTPVIRVLGVTVLIAGVKNVQQAYVSKHLQFKRFFFATLIGTLTAAVVGVVLALCGFGVWALVAQHLVNTAIDTFCLWLMTKWRPKRLFAFSRLKRLISFGWKILASALLSTITNDLHQLIIGLKFSPADLSFFNRGKKLPSTIVDNVNSSIDSVLFPVMSSSQTDKDRVRSMTQRSISVSTFIIMPLMAGFAACGKPFVSLALTDKWLPCLPFLYIFCALLSFYPIHTANLNAIKAIGRSDIFLKLDIIKKIISIGILFISIQFGVLAIALGQLVSSVLSQVINAYPNKRLLNYSYFQQLKDILPSFLLAIMMGGIVWSIQLLGLKSWITLLIQIPVGILVYLGGARLFRMKNYYYLIGMLKNVTKKKNKSIQDAESSQ